MLTTQVIIVLITVMGSLLLGWNRKGFNVRVGFFGLIIGMAILVAYGAVPEWGYVIIAFLLIALMFGIGGKNE